MSGSMSGSRAGHPPRRAIVDGGRTERAHRGRGKLGGERESNLTPGDGFRARGGDSDDPALDPAGDATRAADSSASKRSRSTKSSPSFAAHSSRSASRSCVNTAARDSQSSASSLYPRVVPEDDAAESPALRDSAASTTSRVLERLDRDETDHLLRSFARFDPNAQPDASPTPRVRM